MIYTATMAAVSGMEAALFRHAMRNDLLARRMPEAVYRWGVRLSLSPVIFFVISIPVALVNTGIAVAGWFSRGPVLRRIEDLPGKPSHALSPTTFSATPAGTGTP